MAIRETSALTGPEGFVEIDPSYRAILTKGFESSKTDGEMVEFTYKLTETDQGQMHDLFFDTPDGLAKTATRETKVAGRPAGTSVRHHLTLVRKKGLTKLKVYQIDQEAKDSRKTITDSVPIKTE